MLYFQTITRGIFGQFDCPGFLLLSSLVLYSLYSFFHTAGRAVLRPYKAHHTHIKRPYRAHTQLIKRTYNAQHTLIQTPTCLGCAASEHGHVLAHIQPIPRTWALPWALYELLLIIIFFYSAIVDDTENIYYFCVLLVKKISKYCGYYYYNII